MTYTVKNYFKQGAGTDNELVLGGTVTSESGSVIDLSASSLSLPTPHLRGLIEIATLAEINAGKVLLAGVSGKQRTVHDFLIKVVGNFGGATSIDLTDEAGTIIASIAIAAATDGAILRPGTANVSLGAGFWAALAAGSGFKIAKVGSAATGGTSVTSQILYTVS